MLQAIWAPIREYLKDQPYWRKIQPLEALVTAYLLSVVAGHRYLAWRYHLNLDVGLYVRSYLFRQITTVFVSVAAVALGWWVYARLPEMRDRPKGGVLKTLAATLGARAKALAGRALIALPLLLACAWVVVVSRPTSATDIPVKVLLSPGQERPFSIETLAYIVYELNNRQQSWRLVFDAQTLNPRSLPDAERCAADPRPALCQVQSYFDQGSGIGITAAPLGEDDHFWEHLARHSVITTKDLETLHTVDPYEFLAYALIVQSTAVHLEEHCGGMERPLLDPSQRSTGDVLQLSFPLASFKGSMLAARLSADDQELLLRCFGPGYLSDVMALLDLKWLREGEVAKNLARHFGTDLKSIP